MGTDSRSWGFLLGRMLWQGVVIWIRALWVFLPLAISVQFLADGVLDYVVDLAQEPGTTIWIFMAVNWLGWLMSNAIILAVVVPCAFRTMHGEKLRRRDLRYGVAQWPGILLGCFLIAFPSFVAPFLVFAGLLSPKEMIVAAFTVTMIPVLLWWLVPPAMVLENLGFWAAMRRSRQLIRGRWLTIGILYIVLSMASYGASDLVSRVLHLVGAEPLAFGSVDVWKTAIGWARALTMTMTAVTITVAYCHLRAEKDGARTDELVRAFD